jgi:glucose-1-phosphate adenylyltransferase
VDSIISDGCKIEGDVERCVLFPGVHIARGSRVENSVIFSYSRVGEDAHVQKAIVDKHVSIAAGAEVGVELSRAAAQRAKSLLKDILPLRAKLSVIGKGARIDSGSCVPTGTIIKPRYKPGRWGEG